MADNLTTFMCRLSWNLGASTFWNTQGLSRAVMELLYLLPRYMAVSLRVRDTALRNVPFLWIYFCFRHYFSTCTYKNEGSIIILQSLPQMRIPLERELPSSCVPKFKLQAVFQKFCTERELLYTFNYGYGKVISVANTIDTISLFPNRPSLKKIMA